MEKEADEIGRMQINPTDYILFSIKDYKGKQYIDLRKYVVSDSYRGFTKQGFRFSAELLKEFEAHLEDMKKALSEREKGALKEKA